MNAKVWIHIILFISLLFIGGCSGESSEAPEPTAIPQAEATAAPAQSAADEPADPTEMEAAPVAPGDPKQAILDALDHMQTVPYRVTTVSTTAETTTYVGEFIPPDRYHVLQENIEGIIIGKDVYLKQEGQWMLMPVDAEALLEGMKNIAEGAETMLNATYLDTETIDGQAASVYGYEKKIDLGGVQINSSAKIWIRAADNLPLKVEMLTETGDKQATVISTYEYDVDIQIEPPPVQ